MEEIMDCKTFLKSWGVLAVSLILFSVGLPSVGHAAESGKFSGTWVANGSRVEFPFSADRKIYTFKLSGHVSLQTTIGDKKNYWSDCVGFSDTVDGVVARCVWKDLSGSEIYISLKSNPLHEGGQVVGTIVGGSDYLKGLSGDLSFTWSSFSDQEDSGKSMIMGQTLDLNGSYQLP
jgi:hypothetical protein